MRESKTYGQAYLDYLNNRSLLRRWIRRAYLKDIRSYCTGRTIDFGCGVGELLTLLPEGSIGLEVNAEAVAFCVDRGLPVNYYEPDSDQYRLGQVEEGAYQTFTMNHVLEHLADPADVLSRLLDSCDRLGISRIVLTVPGEKGYASDQTHLTFVDEDYFRQRGLFEHPAYGLLTHKHFPVNWRRFGRWFTHNEYRLVFDRRHA